MGFELRFHVQEVLIVAGVAIIIAGFVLHAIAPKDYVQLIYRGGLGLGFDSPGMRTIAPALTYGITFLLIGVSYSRVGHAISNVLMLILLIVSNGGFAFVIQDFLTWPTTSECASLAYFFIAQTLTYPWIIANVASIFYFLSALKHQKKCARYSMMVCALGLEDAC